MYLINKIDNLHFVLELETLTLEDHFNILLGLFGCHKVLRKKTNYKKNDSHVWFHYKKYKKYI